ncbi:hypothetical protein Tco_0857217 [Tanacetum coccineum]|uniref:Uncharacterized protein n=1 Tax=Tanacetum coccineum TaxID=301880 RepID=A0ABQ5B5R9_9ASTR
MNLSIHQKITITLKKKRNSKLFAFTFLGNILSGTSLWYQTDVVKRTSILTDSKVEVAAPPKKLEVSTRRTKSVTNTSSSTSRLANGQKYKVYKETATGEKFYSKPLTVIAPELSIIDMAELDALVIDEGGQANPTPVQAPPLPPAAARTMPQRMARLEEDVHEIRGTLAEQHDVISAMAHDFSRFCTWTTTSLVRMMDRAGVT